MAYHTKSLFNDEELSTRRDISGQVVRVALDTGADAVFDYLLPEALGPVQIGQRVQVPFGRSNKLVQAFVVELVVEQDDAQKSKRFKLKHVKQIIDVQPLINTELMSLAKWISQYYICPLGQALAAMVPSAVKKDMGAKKQQMIYLPQVDETLEEGLRSKQQKAIVGVLRTSCAVDEASAIERGVLLELAECTAGPLKQLIRKGIVAVKVRTVLKALPAIPANLSALDNQPVVLNSDQQKAVDHVTDQVQSDTFGITLLHGVTDSGKTEVYIRAIEQTLAVGKQAIVLLPEIALTAQTVARFKSRFEKLAVLHSGLTGPQRNAQWQMIRSGQADVVIGARSAVFAPLVRVGLIVVDEEHEPSYKQDTVPRYHGRDVAVKRAHLNKAQCLLGSATPSLESLYNCKTKEHYTLVELPKRVNDLPMPAMKLVDLTKVFNSEDRRRVRLLSPMLEEQLKLTLERGEQAILLLNRRGYSNFVFCPSCNHTLHCQNCDVTLTFHKKPGRKGAKETIVGRHLVGGYAVCHYCSAKTLVPKVCPLCQRNMIMIGLGAQRLEEELADKYADATIKRIDSDSMAGENYYEVLRDFGDGKIDVLAGTQMLAKGLHFPNVTLVGIISADTSLALPDFRANERTFQLISQVAGRAGRSEKPGQVIIQTFLPDQPAIRFALDHNFKAFVKEELVHRKFCHLPPFGRMAIVVLRDPNYEKLDKAATMTRERLDQIIADKNLEIKLRGPMEASISRIQRYHRMQILVQAPNATVIQTLFNTFRVQTPIRPAVQTQVDIDPIYVL